RGTQSRSGQPLLHGSKAGVDCTSGEKLYVLIRIQTKMLHHQPRRRLKSAAESVEPNSFALKLLDRLKLRPGDERDGCRRQVTGDDLDRKSSDRRADAIPKDRIIIEFAANQRRR